MHALKFKVLKKNGNARKGWLQTPHGKVETPVFMPVGTQGSVKALTADDLKGLGAQIVLGNTYHLYLRPGEETVSQMGGLHSFSLWPGPMLTDSGGYQVSSLGAFKTRGEKALSKIDDDGVTFYSHLDGSVHRFTPEKSVQIQADLGADIIMAFDEATPLLGKEYSRAAMERTHAWLVRSKQEWLRLEAVKRGKTGHPPQALFGIIQGGIYRDLRRESAQFVLEQNLPGIALGGASVGQDPIQTEESAAYVRDMIPDDKPWYFMGVGADPQAAVAAIQSGADMFDCVSPTRLARCGLLYHGHLSSPKDDISRAEFVSEYPQRRLAIDQIQFKKDDKPILEGCDCYTCAKGYSRAYLHHLYKARELTYYRLASIHNLRVMVRVVDQIRALI